MGDLDSRRGKGRKSLKGTGGVVSGDGLAAEAAAVMGGWRRRRTILPLSCLPPSLRPSAPYEHGEERRLWMPFPSAAGRPAHLPSPLLPSFRHGGWPKGKVYHRRTSGEEEEAEVERSHFLHPSSSDPKRRKEKSGRRRLPCLHLLFLNCLCLSLSSPPSSSGSTVYWNQEGPPAGLGLVVVASCRLVQPPCVVKKRCLSVPSLLPTYSFSPFPSSSSYSFSSKVNKVYARSRPSHKEGEEKQDKLLETPHFSSLEMPGGRE